MDVNEELKFCENSIKNKKNFGGVGGWVGGGGSGFGEVRVDVNDELKFLGKFTQKKSGGGGVGRGGGQVGVGLVGWSGWMRTQCWG